MALQENDLMQLVRYERDQPSLTSKHTLYGFYRRQWRESQVCLRRGTKLVFVFLERQLTFMQRACIWFDHGN